MEKMAHDKSYMFEELVAAAAKFSKEENAFEKIAEVVEEDDLDKILALCKIEKRASDAVVFTDRELIEANRVYSLYKQAKMMVAQEQSMKDFVARALPVLEKSAFVGAIAGAIGRGIGSLAAKGVGAALSPLKSVASNIGRFGAAAEAQGLKTPDAVKAFDATRKASGSLAAKAQFGGASPSILHRKGLPGTLETGFAAASGLSLAHHSDVWGELNNSN